MHEEDGAARGAPFLESVAEGEAALSGPIARRLLEQVRSGNGRGSGIPDRIASLLGRVLKPIEAKAGNRRVDVNTS